MKPKTMAVQWALVLALTAACNNSRVSSNNTTIGSTEPGSVDQGPGVYCEAVEQRVSPADCEDLTRADALVQPGAAAFNVPEPMRRGQTATVHLVIDRRSPREIRVIEERRGDDISVDTNTTNGSPDANESGTAQDTNRLAGGDEPPRRDRPSPTEDAPQTPGEIVERLDGTPERFYPPVGRHMRAELVGQGFDIEAQSPPAQEIPLGGQASWIWTVTAREGGSRSLTLVTIVEGVANGRRFVLARTPRARSVTVEVSLRDRIWGWVTEAPTWIKAITAIVVALGGLLTAWFALPWWRRSGDGKQDGPPKNEGEAADETDPGGKA